MRESRNGILTMLLSMVIVIQRYVLVQIQLLSPAVANPIAMLLPSCVGKKFSIGT